LWVVVPARESRFRASAEEHISTIARKSFETSKIRLSAGGATDQKQPATSRMSLMDKHRQHISRQSQHQQVVTSKVAPAFDRFARNH